MDTQRQIATLVLVDKSETANTKNTEVLKVRVSGYNVNYTYTRYSDGVSLALSNIEAELPTNLFVDETPAMFKKRLVKAISASSYRKVVTVA